MQNLTMNFAANFFFFYLLIKSNICDQSMLIHEVFLYFFNPDYLDNSKSDVARNDIIYNISSVNDTRTYVYNVCLCMYAFNSKKKNKTKRLK